MKKYFLAALLVLQISLSFAATEISMNSESGDYIGQGLDYDFTELTGTFTVTYSSNLLTVSYTSLDNNDRFTYYFSSPDSLAVGAYFNATRYPFQGPVNPGLSISGNGRGCNTLGGHFIIHEMSVSNNTVQNLSLDFVQHCENLTPSLQGSIRVNSTVPLPNPIPAAYAGEDKTVLENTNTELNGEQSYDADGSIVSYAWEQIAGQEVVITDPSISVTDFLIPDNLPLGGEDFEFRLTVFDDVDNQATDTVIFHGRSSLDPYTFISMVSDSGDYIGGGLTYDLNQDNGSFSITTSSNVITINYSGGVNNLNFNFSAPNGLTEGAYFGATRYPFQSPSLPGMSVSGNGRGCNQLTGYFVIYDISIVNQGLETLALYFEQHCEGGDPALTGDIRINSNVPVPNPLPVAYAGGDVLTDENSVIVMDGGQSFDIDGVISSYSWQQISGTSVTISDNTSSTFSFTTPENVPLGGEDLDFVLTVADDSGNQATDNVVVHVNSKSDPKTYMILNSEVGDYIGAGLDWFYSTNDAVFSLNSNYDNGISVQVNSGEYWSLDFAAAGNVELTTGSYSDATRFPFQAITENGLSISGAGRGCNTLTGQFEVMQLTYDNGGPERFAVNFEQYCSGNTAALTGEIYVNALDPSVPVSNAGVNITTPENINVTLNGSESYDPDGSIASYLWSQISGPSVILSDTSDVRPTFVAPALADRQLSTSLEFQLLVEDNLGFMNASTVAVVVEADNESPVANDFSVEVNANLVSNINVTGHTSDSDGMINLASIEIVQRPANGQLVVNSDGMIDFTPDNGYLGVDSFSYTVIDNDGAISNAGVVSINIVDPEVNADQPTSPEADLLPSSDNVEKSGNGGASGYLFMYLLFFAKLIQGLRSSRKYIP